MSFTEIFLTAAVALRAVTEQEKEEEKTRAMINEAIIVEALVSVTVNGQRRPSTQHLQSSRVHVNRYVQAAKKKENERRNLLDRYNYVMLRNKVAVKLA